MKERGQRQGDERRRLFALYERQEAQLARREGRPPYKAFLAGGLMVVAIVAFLAASARFGSPEKTGLVAMIVTPICFVSLPAMLGASVLCFLRRKRGYAVALSLLGSLGGTVSVLPSVFAISALVLVLLAGDEFES